MTNASFPPGSGGAPPTSSYQTGPSISSVPRRSSYASVVSGAAATPQRSGAFSHLVSNGVHSTSNQPSASYPPQYHGDGAGGRSHRPSASLDADMQTNNGTGSSSWRRSSGPLPAHSRQFAGFPEYSAFLHGTDSFFVPSFLKNSRYITRLEAAHRSKQTVNREPGSGGPSSLSASSSHVNLPRMAPSHRGMTYDIVEKEPVTEEENLMPLPSRWSESERHVALDLMNDGLDVRYMGAQNKHDHEAAAARANHPMPPQCGIYYFEVTIMSKTKEGMIAVGFSSNKASLERLPGWEQESWAYHGDDGKSFFGEHQGQGRDYGPKFTTNDIIGCGVNFSKGCAFFTKNGVDLGTAFHDLPNVKLYPSVGMKKQPNVHVTVNFGQLPFMFDIDGMVKQERLAVLHEISITSTSNLQPPLDETSLIQEIVAQFLAHDGYIETLRAFTHEVREESAALHNGRSCALRQYADDEDLDATNRQKIRSAILDGDIDKALKYTHAFYEAVLQDNPHIYFQLRCRKFLEMLRRSSELSSNSSRQNKSSNGAALLHDDDDVFEQEEEMELDDQIHDTYSDTDGMETEEPESTHELLTEAVQYGQQLRADCPSDDHGDDRKFLEDIFSLVAYADPKSSVHGHYLDPAGRIAVAEELNSAILVSLGRSSFAAMERLCQQTEVLINEISDEGGAAAFINIRNDFLSV